MKRTPSDAAQVEAALREAALREAARTALEQHVFDDEPETGADMMEAAKAALRRLRRKMH